MPGKTASPPPLPHEVLARVWRLASVDGRMLLVIAAVFALFAAAVRDPTGTIAGVLAAGAGALELHGANRLQLSDPRGVRWLVASQLALLGVVLGYITARLLLLEPALVAELITPEFAAQFAAAGISREEIPGFVLKVARYGYGALAVGSLAYQGGMAWYFFRRRHVIRQALEESPEA